MRLLLTLQLTIESSLFPPSPFANLPLILLFATLKYKVGKGITGIQFHKQPHLYNVLAHHMRY